MSFFCGDRHNCGFSADDSTISLLEVFDINTSQRILIREFDGFVEAPQFSADGDNLIYNQGGKLYRYEFVSKKSYEIISEFCDNCTRCHVIMPSGEIAVSHITFEDDLPRIYIISEADEFPPRLITPLGASYVYDCSEDGSELLYSAHRSGAKDIYVISSRGGRELNLTSGGINDTPEFSPCGEFIYLSSASTEREKMQIHRIGRNGGTAQLTNDEYCNICPHISFDNKNISFLSCKDGENFLIRIMPVSGGKAETLVSFAGSIGSMNVNSWSPDNTKLAFISYRK